MSSRKSTPTPPSAATSAEGARSLGYADEAEAWAAFEKDPAEVYAAVALQSAAAAAESEPRTGAPLMAYAKVMAQLSNRAELARITAALEAVVDTLDHVGAALGRIEDDISRRPES